MPTHWVDLASLPGEGRVVLRLSGCDTVRFVQGTLSADVEGLASDEARPAALLTIKGRIVCDAVVVPLGGGDLGLLVPAEEAVRVGALLDRHIVMDDVAVATPNVVVALVWGEGATAVGGDSVLAFTTSHPAPGRLLVGPAKALHVAVDGVTRANAEQWAIHRIQTASPAWGHELEPERFPPEVGFVGAVSYDKGCFMGQEPLARIHARGQVNWVMARVEADRVPAHATSGPVALSHPERADAGRWTTWASEAGHVIGLAIVRRSFAVPGTVLSAEGTGAVRVLSGPLGDDPGLRA